MQPSKCPGRAFFCVLLLAVTGGVVSAGTFPVDSNRAYRTMKNRVRAAQFLSRTTFGPTQRDINRLAKRIGQIGHKAAFEEWIDGQFARPVTYHVPLAEAMVADDGFSPTQSGINVSRYRDYALWHNAIRAEDQLRQRMAWALIQIFVVGNSGNNFNSNTADNQGVGRWLGLGIYYDMLLDNAFGNYRDTIEDVTLSPIMGVWLSHVNNRLANPDLNRFPDENYAREVKQLFSIGIAKVKLNGTVVKVGGVPVETYDNEDIKEFAKVFTGLTYAGNSGFAQARNYSQPMVMFENQHEPGEKHLLNGTVLPAGQTGMQDIAGALDNLFHHDNCPPFIARRLIQRFVMSNPSKGYIKRVAQAFIDNGQGVRGDFRALMKAMLLDRDALNSLTFQKVRDPATNKVIALEVGSRGTEFSRLREPLLRYTAMLRAFNATSNYTMGYLMIPNQFNDMNQGAYQSPTVFNFYMSDDKPSSGEFLSYLPSRRIPNGEIVAPEFSIFTPVVANRFANQFRADIVDQKLDFTLINNSTAGNRQIDIFLDFTREIALAGSDPDALMEHLDLLLCHGTMRDSSRATIAQIIAEETNDAPTRAEQAILAVLTSPDCAISE